MVRVKAPFRHFNFQFPRVPIVIVPATLARGILALFEWWWWWQQERGEEVLRSLGPPHPFPGRTGKCDCSELFGGLTRSSPVRRQPCRGVRPGPLPAGGAVPRGGHPGQAGPSLSSHHTTCCVLTVPYFFIRQAGPSLETTWDDLTVPRCYVSSCCPPSNPPIRVRGQGSGPRSRCGPWIRWGLNPRY